VSAQDPERSAPSASLALLGRRQSPLKAALGSMWLSESWPRAGLDYATGLFGILGTHNETHSPPAGIAKKAAASPRCLPLTLQVRPDTLAIQRLTNRVGFKLIERPMDRDDLVWIAIRCQT
jgi:hypothetical protein